MASPLGYYIPYTGSHEPTGLRAPPRHPRRPSTAPQLVTSTRGFDGEEMKGDVSSPSVRTKRRGWVFTGIPIVDERDEGGDHTTVLGSFSSSPAAQPPSSPTRHGFPSISMSSPGASSSPPPGSPVSGRMGSSSASTTSTSPGIPTFIVPKAVVHHPLPHGRRRRKSSATLSSGEPASSCHGVQSQHPQYSQRHQYHPPPPPATLLHTDTTPTPKGGGGVTSSYINLDAAGAGIGDSPVASIRSFQYMQPLPPPSPSPRLSAMFGGNNQEREGERKRTLSQRSARSIASLFDSKRHSLMRKLSKLSMRLSSSASGEREQRDSYQPQPQPSQAYPSPQPSVPQPLPSAAVSPPRPRSSSRTKPNLHITPPPPHHSSGVVISAEDDGTKDGMPTIDIRRKSSEAKNEDDDELVVSPPKSASVYSQASPPAQQQQQRSSVLSTQRNSNSNSIHTGIPVSPPRRVPVPPLTPPPIPGPLHAARLSASTVSSAPSMIASPVSHSSYSRSACGWESRRESHASSLPAAPDVGIDIASAAMDRAFINHDRDNDHHNEAVLVEDDSGVDSYYDILITSARLDPSPYSNRAIHLSPLSASPQVSPQSPSREDEEQQSRHPYAYAFTTFPSGYADNRESGDRDSRAGHYRQRGGGRRLSPIPSQPGTLKSSASTPDLRVADDAGVVGSENRKPQVGSKTVGTGGGGGGGGGGKERWLSADMIAILLPRPKFKVMTKTLKMPEREGERKEKEKEKSKGAERKEALRGLNRRYSRSLIDLASTAGFGGHDASGNRVLSPGGPSVGHGAVDMSEFGAQREPEIQQVARDTRRSLLSIDRVLEERDKLQKDRMKWQAQATKSLGNKQARTMSRARSKSLTQAGRKMRVGHNNRHQQSSIDYLAARACLGDQDIILVDENADTAAPTKRDQHSHIHFVQPKHEPQHERKISTSSGVATASGGGHSSYAFSQQSHGHASANTDNHGHKRSGSWSRSALKLAKSLPQLCGLGQDDGNFRSPNEATQGQQLQQDSQARDPSGLEEALKSNDTRVILFTDPATTSTPLSPDDGTPEEGHQRKPSPSPSGASEGVAVGIAISTPPSEPPAPAFVYHDHPYTIGAHRVDAKPSEEPIRVPIIRLPGHPYAQGDVSMNGEAGYAGPHPASSAMATELMANLGLSGVSARHRLPPQVALAQHPHPRREDTRQSQQHRQKRQGSQGDSLYVKVEDTRNSYQDLRPYLRVDSNVPPPERLWVAYSPGVVREVMSNEVSQYSPVIEDVNDTRQTEPGAGQRSQKRKGSEDGQDFFLQRYKRMSTIYQDTAAMSQALGNAMYDAYDTRISTIAEPRHSIDSDSGIGTSEEQATRDGTHDVLDVPETILERTEASTSGEQLPSQSSPFRKYMLPQYDMPSSHETSPNQAFSRSNLSISLGSSPILPHSSPHQNPPFVFNNPFPTELEDNSEESSPPASPTAPRVGSPDNLEPFHGLFYKPPGEAETDSLSFPSPRLPRIVVQDDRSHTPEDVQWGAETYPSRRLGSGLTTLIKQMSDELEQMALERHYSLGRSSNSPYSQASILQRSVTAANSDISRTGSESSSGQLFSEAGPLHFVLDDVTQQESSQTGYVPRPDFESTFYASTPVPEDIQLSRASSPFEGTVEDETVRLPSIYEEANPPSATFPSSSASDSDQLSYVPNSYQSDEYLSPEPPLSSGTQGPDDSRSSYQAPSSLSRISTLSEFPTPPDRITPEEMSLLTAHRDDITINSSISQRTH